MLKCKEPIACRARYFEVKNTLRLQLSPDRFEHIKKKYLHPLMKEYFFDARHKAVHTSNVGLVDYINSRR